MCGCLLYIGDEIYDMLPRCIESDVFLFEPFSKGPLVANVIFHLEPICLKPFPIQSKKPNLSNYAQSITIEIHYLSNEKNPGWLCYIGDEKLPSYIGIIKKKHYKDPY